MKLCFVVFLTTASLLGSQTVPALAPASRIADVRRLPVNAGNRAAVRLRGVVTALSGWKNSFFLQDASGGISVDREEDAAVRVGDEVEVTGVIRPGLFAPIVVTDHTQVLGTAALPETPSPSYADLVRGKYDSQRIELEGIVHSAHIGTIWGKQVLFIDLHTVGGAVPIYVLDFAGKKFDYLVDSKVRMRGVCGTIFNDRRQLIGLRLFVPGLDRIEIESTAIAPSLIPLSSLPSLLGFNPDMSLDHRVKIAGTVTYQAAPGEVYLQEAGVGMLVASSEPGFFQSGTQMEAIGFAVPGAYSPILQDAVLRPIRAGAAPPAIPVAPADIITVKDGFTLAPYDGRLVQLEANVVESLPGPFGQTWFLREGDVRFEAQFKTDSHGQRVEIEPGSRVRLTGICITESDENRNPKSFKVLLRSAQDLAILHTRYSTVSPTYILVMVILLFCVGAVIWPLGWRKDPVAPRKHAGRRWTDHISPYENSGQRRTGPPSEPRKIARGADRVAGPENFGRIGWVSSFRSASTILAAVVYTSGVLVLAGWIFHIQTLMSVSPDYVNMKANAALAFLAAGSALWILNRSHKSWLARIAEMLGAFVAVIGILTLIEYGTGWNLHIDELLFREPGVLRATVSPGRMAFLTAFGFSLIGCALILVRRARSIALAQGLAILTGIFALLNLVSYVYGVQNFNGFAVHAAMAIHTSALLLLLSAGVLFYRADSGPMKALSSPAPGGVMGRRLMPMAVFLPVALGWLRWRGQLSGLYDTAFGLALFASANVVSFCFLIWNSAAFLNRLDLARSEAERELGDREAELRESEKHYRGVVESLPQIVWTCLPDGRCDYLSQRWTEYTGAPFEGQLEFDWSPHIHPDDTLRFEQRWSAAVEAGTTFDEEIRFRNAAGEYRWFRAVAVALRASGGAVIKWFGTCTDIHGMKIAEAQIRSFNQELEKKVQERTGELLSANEELSQTRNRLQTILDSATQVAIVVLDCDGVIQLFSQGAEKLLGYQAAEVIGKQTPHLFVPLEDCELRAAALSEQTGRPITIREIFAASSLPIEPYTREETHVRRDGTKLTVTLAVAPMLDGQGKRIGTLGISSDVTPRRRLETRLTETNAELRKQTAEAEQATRAKSDFLAAMSHEIRTPMNSILGTTDLLLETGLDSGQERLVSICQRNSKLLLSLINDLLDLSKIDADAIQLEKVPFSVSEMAGDVEQIFFANARAKNIALRIVIAAGVPAVVVGDPNRVKQVLINLLSNAFKFTAAGHVSLTVSLEEKQSETCRLRFAVADTGIGIAAEHIDSIFDAFQQADSSVTRRFGGTGLGLAICKRFLALMGGAITVESTVGLGSTFSFTVEFAIAEGAETVPFDRTGEKPATAVTGERHPLLPQSASIGSEAKGVILAVEDNEDNAFLLDCYLSPEGYRLDFASNGAEAVEKVKRGGYALVLMDVQMPVMDGYTATREIRAWESANGIAPVPILALTAHSLRGEAEKSRQAGCSGYLSKPLLRLDLIREVAARAGVGVTAEELAVAAAAKELSAQVPTYMARRSEDAGRMREFLGKGAFEQIGVLGHHMAGNGAGYGFPALSLLGAEIEKAAAAHSEFDLQNHLRSLEAFVQRFQAGQVKAAIVDDVPVPI